MGFRVGERGEGFTVGVLGSGVNGVNGVDGGGLGCRWVRGGGRVGVTACSWCWGYGFGLRCGLGWDYGYS